MRSFDPAAAADEVPLSIDELDVPIDHAGPYTVTLGQATLPNGVLTSTAFGVTSSPLNPLVTVDGYNLAIRSLDGGPAFESAYQHGWRPGWNA